MSGTAYIVFAHGSSVESANDAVRAVAAEMARRGDLNAIAAFLEGGNPDLKSAVAELSGRAARIVVVPYFLTLGLHLQRDLPKLIDACRREHPGVDIEVTPPLDGHPGMVDALLDRAHSAAARPVCKPA